MVQRNKNSLISLEEARNQYVSSRFNVRTQDEAGNLLLLNSYSGQFLTVPKQWKDEVIQLLDRGTEDPTRELAEPLIAKGFLISSTVDEFMRANLQHKESLYKNRMLNLILMPNENCNFRCIYCYESFAKNRMDEGTQQGVVEFVRREMHKYDRLHISWFGGEPLTALDIVETLSVEFIKICVEQGKKYSSNMTTNGYLLTPDVFERLYQLGVRSHQITFDGTKETHDRHRIRIDGDGTFDVILANVIAMKQSPHEGFKIVIRSNIDEDNRGVMDEYISLMAKEFADDNRFAHHFVPVQMLGGDHDTNIHLCDTKDILPLMEQAQEEGLTFSLYRQMFQPYGSVCYAAKPSSFVIGSDGMVYKCTVAFDEERNHVGQLYPSGVMELYYDRLALWLANGAAEDPTCQKCYFRPACQGEACPLERIEKDRTPCPPTKKNIKAYMRLIAKEAVQERLVPSQSPANLN